MVDFLKFKLKYVLIIFVWLIPELIQAAPTIKFTATPGNCPANGSITITATGVTGTVLYAIKKESDLLFSPQQESNVFLNLESATYIVVVYDASGTTLSSLISLKNIAYTTMTTSSILAGNAVVTGCGDDGSITLTITGGTAPYRYHLKDGPTTAPDVQTLLKKVVFSQLSTGVYGIDITDACGNVFSVSGISVESKYNISGYDLKSFELQTPTLSVRVVTFE